MLPNVPLLCLFALCVRGHSTHGQDGEVYHSLLWSLSQPSSCVSINSECLTSRQWLILLLVNIVRRKDGCFFFVLFLCFFSYSFIYDCLKIYIYIFCITGMFSFHFFSPEM